MVAVVIARVSSQSTLNIPVLFEFDCTVLTGVKILADSRDETEMRYSGHSRHEHRQNRRVEVAVIR